MSGTTEAFARVKIDALLKDAGRNLTDGSIILFEHALSDGISEVTSRRVLSKNAPAQKVLGELFDQHRGRFTEHTRLTADIKLPDLSRDSFIDLYPLLPYQIDLIIQVVSGLRTQGGASRHVGGANRTIIKLAQQLLINPAVNLADQPIGSVARLDQVYDLAEGNIGSEVRAKISTISKELDHPLARPAAKVICLLQYVKSVHRTAENIAAALHPGVAGDSQLAAVKDALQQLEAANKVRVGDDGYRISTPAEDDWERIRNGISPKPGDAHRIYSEVLASFWQPQPTHTLFDTKTFKAGLAIYGREIVDGDMMFHVHLAEDGTSFQALASELRARSQQERKSVFWAVSLNDSIDRETVERFRSKEMLARKEREATRGYVRLFVSALLRAFSFPASARWGRKVIFAHSRKLPQHGGSINGSDPAHAYVANRQIQQFGSARDTRVGGALLPPASHRRERAGFPHSVSHLTGSLR